MKEAGAGESWRKCESETKILHFFFFTYLFILNVAS